MGSSSGSTVSGDTGLQRDNRFLGVLADFHEAAAVLQTFNVKGCAAGSRIIIEPFDDVSEVDISHVAEGEQFVKTDTAEVCTGIQSDQQSTGL